MITICGDCVATCCFKYLVQNPLTTSVQLCVYTHLNSDALITVIQRIIKDPINYFGSQNMYVGATCGQSGPSLWVYI